MNKYVFDSYAIIAFFENEQGAILVEKALTECFQNKAEGCMSIINWGEVYYSISRVRGVDDAEQAIAQLTQYPIELVSADKSYTKEAALLKSKHPIAYADCFAAALAKEKKAILLTGDPEFKRLENYIKIEWLV